MPFGRDASEKQKEFYDHLKNIAFESNKQEFFGLKEDIRKDASLLTEVCAYWEKRCKGRVTLKHLRNIRESASNLSSVLSEKIRVDEDYYKIIVQRVQPALEGLSKAFKDASKAVFPHIFERSTLDYKYTRKLFAYHVETLSKTTIPRLNELYVQGQQKAFGNGMKEITIDVSNERQFMITFKNAMSHLSVLCDNWCSVCRNKKDRKALVSMAKYADVLCKKIPPIDSDTSSVIFDKSILEDLRFFRDFLLRVKRDAHGLDSLFYPPDTDNKLLELVNSMDPDDREINGTFNFFLRQFNENKVKFFEDLDGINFNYDAINKDLRTTIPSIIGTLNELRTLCIKWSNIINFNELPFTYTSLHEIIDSINDLNVSLEKCANARVVWPNLGSDIIEKYRGKLAKLNKALVKAARCNNKKELLCFNPTKDKLNALAKMCATSDVSNNLDFNENIAYVLCYLFTEKNMYVLNENLKRYTTPDKLSRIKNGKKLHTAGEQLPPIYYLTRDGNFTASLYERPQLGINELLYVLRLCNIYRGCGLVFKFTKECADNIIKIVNAMAEYDTATMSDYNKELCETLLKRAYPDLSPLLWQ